MELHYISSELSKDGATLERPIVSDTVPGIDIFLNTNARADDSFASLRRVTSVGDFKNERKIHDMIFWIIMFPLLVALYFNYSWLSASHRLDQ